MTEDLYAEQSPYRRDIDCQIIFFTLALGSSMVGYRHLYDSGLKP